MGEVMMEVIWVNNVCDLRAEANIPICFQVSMFF